jgi:superfamily II DNA or RNA helicase
MRKKVNSVPLIVDSFIRINKEKITPNLIAQLKKRFTHNNPEFYKKLRLGFYLGSTSKFTESYFESDPFMAFPRGCMDDIKEILMKNNFVPNPIIDKTIRLESIKIDPTFELRDYQIEAADMLCKTGNGTVRGPCGSGKTIILLAAIAKLAQPTLVIVHSGVLFEQWYRMVSEWFGFAPGEIRGSKVNIKKTTIGMQQSIWRKVDPDWADKFGCICGDEIHRWAAQTFQKTAEMFSAKYRIGASADERRKDGKEFLIYNTFGDCKFVIHKQELEKKKKLVPVLLKLIRTKYYHEEFILARDMDEVPDWTQLINDLVFDSDRNKLILKNVLKVLKNKDNKILILNERVGFCKMFHEILEGLDIKSGCMIGGPANQEELESTKAGLKDGDLRVGIGTKVADEGLDIPSLTHIFLTCPVHTHPKRMEQMSGRSARPYKNKKYGTVFYFWDSELWPHVKEKDNEEEKLFNYFKIFKKVAKKVYVDGKVVKFS